MTKLRIGFIGTAHVHAEGISQALLSANEIGYEVELVGAATAKTEFDQPIASLPEVSLERLLDEADAVVVAGTNRDRAAATLAALDENKFVLTEKPVALKNEELEKLAAHPNRSKVMVAFPMRFASALAQARDAIESGAIGTPLGARGTNHGQFPGGWFGTKELAGGGALTDHIVHLSDGLSWILDSPAKQVYAVANNHMLPDLEVESSGIATLDFANGMFASIDSSWSRPKSFPTWGDVYLVLVGSAGRMIVNPMARRLDIYDDEAGKLRHVPYGTSDIATDMVHEFVRFVAGELESSPIPIEAGIHASKVVMAAYKSVNSRVAEPIG